LCYVSDFFFIQDHVVDAYVINKEKIPGLIMNKSVQAPD